MFIRKRFVGAVGSRRLILKAVGVAATAAVICIGCGNPAGNDGGDKGKSGGGGDPNPTNTPSGSTFTDSRDSKTYKKVTIGSQTWMGENLNYNAAGSKCYGEGGEVEVYDEATGSWDLKTLTTAEVQANCAKYGRLYDWETAMNGSSSSSSVPSGVRGVCPSGWHLPSEVEWYVLDGNVGGWDVGTKLKSSTGWNSSEYAPAGTDDFGFSALPGGDGNSDGNFNDAGYNGDWWSATESNANYA